MAVFSRKEIESGGPSKAPPVVDQTIPGPVGNDPVPILPRKPRADDPWFSFEHPDATQGGAINATIEVAGKTVKVERSRIETQSEAVRDELIRRGWRWMNERF